MVSIISSCNKKENPVIINTTSSTTTTTTTTTTTINNNTVNTDDTVAYISGYTNDGHKSTPVYWRNNVVHNLSNTVKGGYATTIASNGVDLYVGGYCTADNGNPTAVYWKNGTPTYLSNTISSNASAIALAQH